MKSIQRSFVLLTLASVLLLSLALGFISLMALVSKADEDASVAMNLTCANEADNINELLEGIEDAVDVEAAFMEERYDELNASRDPADWLNEAEVLFSSIAEQTDGAIVYYFRAGAGADADARGFFYVRDNADDQFRNMPLAGTEGVLPGEDPAANVGWDEAALREGRPLWLSPFEIDDLGIQMVTYVEPVVVNGEYRGIVGMGVDFQRVIDQVKSISSYEKGYGFLTDAKGNVMYHPIIPFGTNLSDDDEDVPAVDEAIAAGTTTDDVVVYRYQDTDKRMAFHLLQNDMRLVLSVNADEIYAERDRLAAWLVGATAVVSVIVVLVAMASSRQMLRPLRKLTEAAEKVASGDLNVKLPRTDTREVSSLVKAYERTVGELREQLKTIEEIARKDALTGFWNKGAFEEDSALLDARIAAGEKPEFALAMLDVNGLKPVNDTYGHEAGDALLERAARRIAETFAGSAFYRVGGDEFAVLMTGDVKELDAVGDDGVSIACGVARYRPGEDKDVAAVLARADALMYQNKRSARA